MSLSLKTTIRDYALSLSFSSVGFTHAMLPLRDQEGLNQYLERGYHGDMTWMEERRHLRLQPKALWPEARSVIMLGQNYAPAENPLKQLKHPHTGSISAYARNLDYHDVMKKKLKILARWLIEQYGGEVKLFVDTAPVMEKPLAAQAGIGWQGKHTCLVSREYGSWLFLASIFTTLDIPPDPPESGHCGTCTKCLDVCPTNAFTKEGQLDARRCIAYLTIEHKGHIAEEFLSAIGNRIYGCDDCLAVCPWNKFATASAEIAYHARAELNAPSLYALAQLDDFAFRQLFRASPIKRIGRDRFVRNVLIAIGNTKDPIYRPVIAPLLQDHSAPVRAMAERAARLCIF